MRKLFIPLLLISFLPISCNSTSSVEAVSYTSDDLSSLSSKYGKFSITRSDSGDVNYEYNSDSNTYTFNIESSKVEYELSGYSDAKFVIVNSNNISDYKGIKLKLNRACLVSSDTSPVISYNLDTKNIQITAKKNTSNKIICISTATAVESASNIEIDGNGTLEVYTAGGGTSGGHAFKADSTISLYDAPYLVINTGHDAFHAKNIITFLSDDTTTVYTGTCIITNAVSQFMEATTSKCAGYIRLTSGNFKVIVCDSVFKSDVSINIDSSTSVIVNTSNNNAVIKQDSNDVDSGVTIPSLQLNVNGTFTVNGESITTQTI